MHYSTDAARRSSSAPAYLRGLNRDIDTAPRLTTYGISCGQPEHAHLKATAHLLQDAPHPSSSANYFLLIQPGTSHEGNAICSLRGWHCRYGALASDVDDNPPPATPEGSSPHQPEQKSPGKTADQTSSTPQPVEADSKDEASEPPAATQQPAEAISPATDDVEDVQTDPDSPPVGEEQPSVGPDQAAVREAAQRGDAEIVGAALQPALASDSSGEAPPLQPPQDSSQ